MILNDTEIKQLSMPPKFVIKKNAGLCSELTPLLSECFYTQDSEEEVKAFVDQQNQFAKIYEYFPVTPEELKGFSPLISPYVAEQVRVDEQGNKILSYGQSSFGYDVRLADEFKIFTNINSTVIDPLDFDPKCLHDHKGPYCIIPPNSYILGHTVEYFRIPKDMMLICLGKSTYARCAAIVNVTPIEPGFEGSIVIEISNATPLPLKVYANQGIAQFLFFKGNPCEISYADRGGKYQGQTGIELARV